MNMKKIYKKYRKTKGKHQSIVNGRPTVHTVYGRPIVKTRIITYYIYDYDNNIFKFIKDVNIF